MNAHLVCNIRLPLQSFMHIRVGFGVARFDCLSNARAFERGTSDKVPTLFDV